MTKKSYIYKNITYDSQEEIDFVIEQLKRIVGRLREMSPLYEDFVKKHR